jgi:hypothetical protein
VKARLTISAIAAFASLVFAESAVAAQPGTDEAESGSYDPEVSDVFTPVETGDFDGAETVEDSRLNEMRGGFRVQGMDISLGADIRTYMNGDLVLHTLVNWSDLGQTKTQFVSDILSPAAAQMVQASAISGGSLSMTLGGSAVFLANEGKTAIAHRTENGLQNVLINTANNQNITQSVDATISLGGYDQFRSTIMSSRLTDSLNGVLGGLAIAAAAAR